MNSDYFPPYSESPGTCDGVSREERTEFYIKSRLKSGIACYLSVQNLLSSSLLSKNIKIKIYRCIIFPVVLYGSGTWSLTLMEERRLSVFETRMLRKVSGPKRNEVTGEWRKYIMRSFITFTAHQILFR
jgi:hypothetical protein